MGTPVYLPPQEQTFPTSNSTWEQWMTEPLWEASEIPIYLFIYLFIYLSLLQEVSSIKFGKK